MNYSEKHIVCLGFFFFPPFLFFWPSFLTPKYMIALNQTKSVFSQGWRFSNRWNSDWSYLDTSWVPAHGERGTAHAWCAFLISVMWGGVAGQQKWVVRGSGCQDADFIMKE